MTTRIVRLATLAAAISFALAACGGDDEESGGRERPARITVWAMGAEGEKLDVLAKDFMAAEPGRQGERHADRLGRRPRQAHHLGRRRQTPDVSQMGTTWMGEFAKTGALEEVPDAIDLSAFFEGARDTAIVDDTPYGVPWYVETRVLYYRTDIAEKAGITEPPTNWDELKDGEGDEGEGRRQVRHLASAEQLAGVPAVRLAERRRGRERGGEWTFDSPEVVEALEYYKSFFDEGSRRRRSRRASTSRRASSPGRTRCSSAARGT